MIRLSNRRKTIVLTIISVVYLMIIWVDTAVSQNCKPLLLPGKQTLFQRVISNPGANVYVSADRTSPIVQASVKPFTIFYVYEQLQVDGAEWLEYDEILSVYEYSFGDLDRAGGLLVPRRASFDPEDPAKFHTEVIRDQDIFRLEVEIIEE